MATRKITLPTGEVLRTATQSRLVLVMAFDKGAFIEKRSASRETLVKHLAKRRNACVGVCARPSGFIADLVSGTVEEV